MAKRTIVKYAVFYGVVILILGGFIVAKFAYLVGDLAPGETRIFKASIFVTELSETYQVDAPDYLDVQVTKIQNFGFFIEYQRTPRVTFDYSVAAAGTAPPGIHDISIKFDSGTVYNSRVTVRRKIF